MKALPTLVLLLTAAACSKKTPVEAAPPAPSASASAAPSASARPTAAAAEAHSADPMATLFGRMAEEAAHRPNIHPSADDAFAAFAKAGLAVGSLEQSLGTTYKAAYCKHGLTTAKDLAVLVCEYSDVPATAVGLTASKGIFPQRRQSWSHKTLLLAVIQQDANAGAPTKAAQQKIVDTFDKL